MQNSLEHDHETKTRLVARVVRDVMRAEAFESIADLKVAIKAKLRALKIPYAPADLDDALTVIASNAPLAAAAPPLRPVPPPDRLVSDPPIVSREHAAEIVGQLRRGLACGTTPRPMPSLDRRPRSGVARELRIVAQAIAMTAAHVDELENTIPDGCSHEWIASECQRCGAVMVNPDEDPHD